MKKTLLSLSLIVLSSFIFSACSLFPSKTNSDLDLNSSPTSSVQSQTSPTSFAQNQTGKFAAINTKYGQIVVKLYDTESPKTVANFLSKANSSFYDNLTFHRVEPGFVVQGGDPKGNGTGGGTIASEINNIPFVRGSVGVARGMDKAVSNDAQFFVCLTTQACQHLTGEYVNFGEVVSGMEFVDKIVVGDKMISISSTTK